MAPPPPGAPAILTYFAEPARSVAEMVSTVLAELERAAIELFPAWLPGAENIAGPGGAGADAVRFLALRLASSTHHFGPFLAHLAERALTGAPTGPSGRPAPSARAVRFAAEVRAAGLARVLAAGFGRPHTALLVHVPEGLSPAGEEILVAACEWLAERADLGVWLTGAGLSHVDRVETVTLSPAGHLTPDPVRGARPPSTGAIRYPAVAGIPHPASKVEKALEAALATCHWAHGRAWNQTYQSHPLINPIRVDLLWRQERCVIEIDGPEHRHQHRHAADRERDLRLAKDGYAVLRITNAEVLTDIRGVVGRLERFVRSRSADTLEGSRHA
ncbi:endonuclease domain-containing protein [Sphaerisporangium corydalis]|uniref:Endonuclease domain-containing protein n=1 Tax=Sphaerisporangium corydalis TaxID=1441875 RepID=A0ABV9E6R5_9ACTN|nr:endonuclease domain-containing protein [Sphaerisporangium corydalis]